MPSLLLFLSVLAPAVPQEPVPTASRVQLGPDLRQRMDDPQWFGRFPSAARWSLGGDSVVFEREREASDLRDLFELDLATGEERPVPDDRRHLAPPERFEADPLRTRFAFGRDGDLFVLERATRELRPLTRTGAREQLLGFSADGASIHFRRDGLVLARDLGTGLERELVRVAFEEDPREKRAEPPEEWLAAQAERLSDVLRERREREVERDERERALRAANPFAVPETFYLDDSFELERLEVAPDERFALVVAKKPGKKPKSDSMPEWVTESGFVEPRDVRALVGDSGREDVRLFLLELEGHEVHELALDVLPLLTDDPLAELRAAQAERERENEEAGEQAEEAEGEEEEEAEGSGVDATDTEPEPRPLSLAGVRWSRDGARLAVALRSHDNKDRWIAEVDLVGPHALVPVHHRRDEAWVGWFVRAFDWTEDGSGLWFVTEASGYAQLALWTGPDAPVRTLTSGEFEVSDVVEAPGGGTLWFRANEGHPGVHEVHRLDLATGAREQVTRLGGRTSFTLSPDGDQLLLEHSKPTQPTELWVQAARPDAIARRLTDSRSEAFLAHDWIEPLVVAVPSPHGRPIWTRVYLPPEGAPGPGPGGRPCVFFVHGAGYLQNAHLGWSAYFREFFFHDWLARRGVVVLDMDYRASAGYGRDWRAAIYRRMGEPELEDLLAGLEYAVDTYGVNRARVGIYGGSYGGFMTLMALFRRPGIFACGAALRPVTDWAHYNHAYTSNILNTPELDPEAFARSSPIEFAGGLEDALLICHGLVDDNVFAKDSIRLAQRLIELGKDDWELALYPVEPHGFREPSSWYDEYRRIAELFEEHLALAPVD